MIIAHQTFDSFSRDLTEILKDNLCEIIIHGSYALGDFQANLGDLDYLTVTNRSLDEEAIFRLFELHEKYRSRRHLLLHQLEGAFYPERFLKDLEGQFTGCYIGTGRKGWNTITTLQNSYMDLRLINEHGIRLLGRSPQIYNPGESEILAEQKSDLEAFKDSAKLNNDAEIRLWISIIHWCSRTLFYRANRKIGSKTEACLWCIAQHELEEFKSWFGEAESLRSPYTETKLPNKARDTCLALLDYVDNILRNTNYLE
jgi:hypothetical protein